MLCTSILTLLRLPPSFHFYCVFFVLFVFVYACECAYLCYDTLGGPRSIGSNQFSPSITWFPSVELRSTHSVASSVTSAPSHGPLENHFHAIAPKCPAPLCGGFSLLVVLPLNDISHFCECPFVAFVFSPLVPWSMKQHLWLFCLKKKKIKAHGSCEDGWGRLVKYVFLRRGRMACEY